MSKMLEIQKIPRKKSKHKIPRNKNNRKKYSKHDKKNARNHKKSWKMINIPKYIKKSEKKH
jgi:hypothetical protein